MINLNTDYSPEALSTLLKVAFYYIGYLYIVSNHPSNPTPQTLLIQTLTTTKTKQTNNPYS